MYIHPLTRKLTKNTDDSSCTKGRVQFHYMTLDVLGFKNTSFFYTFFQKKIFKSKLERCDSSLTEWVRFKAENSEFFETLMEKITFGKKYF